jgi:hypothetical protein
MARHNINISDHSMASFDRVVGRLRDRMDNGTGVGMWVPTQSKVLEFLVWVYEELCKQGKLTAGDEMKFEPATAPQGRQRRRPTPGQLSTAAKVLRGTLKRDPTEAEVLAFVKRNPDVGAWEAT